MKVENIKSNRSGESVRNQFIITDGSKVYFQSYDSVIAIWNGDKLVLGRDWDYSVTTMKYLHQFMRDYCYKVVRQFTGNSGADSIRKLIDTGVIEYNPELV